MDPVAEQDQVQAIWWQEKQDEVTYGFLVEPQKKGRARMTMAAKSRVGLA
jgi:hypothetical protein